MLEFFKSRMARSLLPYLLLAIGVIISWHLISEFTTFAEWIRRGWLIVTPFFHGFILAYIINIPCSAIQRLLGKTKLRFFVRFKRGIGIIITYLLFVALVVAVLWFIIPRIVSSITQFIDEAEDHFDNLLYFLDNFDSLEFIGIYVNAQPDVYGDLPEALMHISTADIEAWVQEFTQDLGRNLDFGNIFSSVVSVFGSAFSVVFSLVLAIISSVFYLFEKERISAFIKRLLGAFTSSGVYNNVLKYSGKLNHNFKQYIYTQTIDGIILGTLATLVLAFIIRSPFALILGLMLGVINYIPYFGSIFGSLIAVVVVAFTQGIGSGALAAGILLVLQQIDGNVIQPKLMGSSFKMSPLLIIISVTVGGALWGVLGMLAAIPIVAVLKDILENVIIHHEQRRSNKQEEASD